MLLAPLVIYFFVLCGALVLGGTATLGASDLLAIGMLTVICLAVLRAWSHLLGSEPWTSPSHVLEFLRDHSVSVDRSSHAPAATPIDLAQAVHVEADAVAAPVIVKADGALWMAVLPATERPNLDALRASLGAETIEVVGDEEAQALFPGCEVGAEPPFGRMFELPSIVEEDLANHPRISFYDGRHAGSVAISSADYLRVEEPRVAHFGVRI